MSIFLTLPRKDCSKHYHEERAKNKKLDASFTRETIENTTKFEGTNVVTGTQYKNCGYNPHASRKTRT